MLADRTRVGGRAPLVHAKARQLTGRHGAACGAPVDDTRVAVMHRRRRGSSSRSPEAGQERALALARSECGGSGLPACEPLHLQLSRNNVGVRVAPGFLLARLMSLSSRRGRSCMDPDVLPDALIREAHRSSCGDAPVVLEPALASLHETRCAGRGSPLSLA